MCPVAIAAFSVPMENPPRRYHQCDQVSLLRALIIGRRTVDEAIRYCRRLDRTASQRAVYRSCRRPWLRTIWYQMKSICPVVPKRSYSNCYATLFGLHRSTMRVRKEAPQRHGLFFGQRQGLNGHFSRTFLKRSISFFNKARKLLPSSNFRIGPVLPHTKSSNVSSAAR